MNYLRVYCNLIRKAEKRGYNKKRAKEHGLYVEGHHIFPVSIFGKNKRIVYLTAREHYIAHALLEKICIKKYGLNHWKTQKMTNAHISMTMKSKYRQEIYVNSKLYENCKLRHSKNMQELIKGNQFGIKGGEKCRDLKLGFFSMSEEERHLQRSKAGKISGKIMYDNKKGIFSRSKEQMTIDGRKSAEKQKELGIGLYGLTFEQRSKIGKKYGKQNAKKLNSQKWRCTVTGKISTYGPLTLYQKKRGIDTSKRIRVDHLTHTHQSV